MALRPEKRGMRDKRRGDEERKRGTSGGGQRWKEMTGGKEWEDTERERKTNALQISNHHNHVSLSLFPPKNCVSTPPGVNKGQI